MTFQLVARFFQERALYRKIVEALAFISYREVREFDFERVERLRAATRAARPF